jgi:hypothetical protein
MACSSQDDHSYQASPGQPCPVRLSRASGKVSRKETVNTATQRGEMITCRGRKPRQDAEGHANAEPPLNNQSRFRIRVGSPIFDRATAGNCAGLRSVGRRLLILGDWILGSSPRMTSVWGCLSQKHRFSPLHCLLWHALSVVILGLDPRIQSRATGLHRLQKQETRPQMGPGSSFLLGRQNKRFTRPDWR